MGAARLQNPRGSSRGTLTISYSSLFPSSRRSDGCHRVARVRLPEIRDRIHPVTSGNPGLRYHGVHGRKLGVEWLAGHMAKSKGVRRLTGQASARRPGGASHREAELLSRRDSESRGFALALQSGSSARRHASHGKSRGHRWQERFRSPASLPPLSHPSARSNSRPRPCPLPPRKH